MVDVEHYHRKRGLRAAVAAPCVLEIFLTTPARWPVASTGHLALNRLPVRLTEVRPFQPGGQSAFGAGESSRGVIWPTTRSEERRVGKGGRDESGRYG